MWFTANIEKMSFFIEDAAAFIDFVAFFADVGIRKLAESDKLI